MIVSQKSVFPNRLGKTLQNLFFSFCDSWLSVIMSFSVIMVGTGFVDCLQMIIPPSRDFCKGILCIDTKLLLFAKNGDKTCNRKTFNELGCPAKNGTYFSTTSLSSQSKEKRTEAEVLKA